MDISVIINIISNLGFPIACIFALAWFGWYMQRRKMEYLRLKEKMLVNIYNYKKA